MAELESVATGVVKGIDIAYRRMGDTAAPAVLLINGIASQLIHWPEAFCNALVEAGLQVISFDHRDSGLSTHLKNAKAPNLMAALRGDLSSVAYTLSDMAGDAVGLLRYLEIASAHVVGVSMGGQIAQTMALEHPERVRSLVSMMSTTGDRGVGQPAREALREIFSGAPPVTREEVVEQMVKAARVIGSPGYKSNESEVALMAGRAYDRGYDPVGAARQAVATVASGDRTQRLRALQVATLVIHGTADRMCDVSGGKATAEAIAEAELWLIAGMGHNLPPGLRSRIAKRIAEFVWKVERGC